MPAAPARSWRVIFMAALLLLLCSAGANLPVSPASAASGPGLGNNGQHRKAYYIVGHNPNTLGEALADLNAGANALEPDVMKFTDAAVDPNLDQINSYAGRSGLFMYHDHVVLTSRVPLTVEAYFDGVHDMVKLQHRNVALITLDMKSAAATPGLVAALQTAVRTHLNHDGVMIYVIYSVGSFDDAGGLDTVATQLNDHEGVMIDGENDPAQVFNTLSGKGAQNIGFGNGSAGECFGLAPNVLTSMDEASWIRVGQPVNFAIPYAFPICNTSRMSEYMKTTDGLIPDEDDLIGGSVGKISDLAGLVASSPDVYLATSADNPFLQGKEGYGLRVSTFDKLSAGTDSDLTFTLFGTCGSASVTLDASYQQRFEQGAVDYVTIPSKDLGHLTSLRLSSDGSGVGPEWDPQTVWFSADKYGIANESVSVNLNYDDDSIDEDHPRTADLTSLHVGGKCDTVTTITSHLANPSVAGELITVGYSVTGPSGPTGQVIVTDDQNNTICTGTVSQASCSGRFPAAGDRVLTASYQGDDNSNPSNTTAVHQVNKADTTTSIASPAPSPNPSVTGQEVKIDFAVAVSTPGALVAPTTIAGDTVSVIDDQGNQICSGTVAAAFCIGRIPAAGARTLTASFSGDGNFKASNGTAAQTVNSAGTTTTITGHAPNPSGAGEPITVNFTVIVNTPGMIVSPTSIGAGIVTVRDDLNSVVCTGTVVAGSCTGPIATAGPRTLTASYAGDSNFLPSTSLTVPQMMEATQKDECKGSGWVSLFRRNATKFVNQGDCIQFVNTHK